MGLNGVGTKAVNALSKDFLVRSHRDGRVCRGQLQAGQAQEAQKNGKDAKEPDGTLIEFEPDPTIFKDTEFRPEHIERRLRHYSYLNTGLKLVYNGKTFQSRHGLMDLVMEDMATDGSEPIYPPLHYSSKTLEFCFTHSNSRYGETFYSFVNGQYTTRRRHAPERVPRGPAQGGERICRQQVRRRRRARMPWSARWRSG